MDVGLHVDIFVLIFLAACCRAFRSSLIALQSLLAIMTVLEGIVTKAGVMGKTVTVTVSPSLSCNGDPGGKSSTLALRSSGFAKSGTSDLVKGDEAA